MDKAEVKERWISALRSGDYQQAFGALHNRDGAMCCLGVLCDVLGAEWVPGNAPGGSMHEGDYVVKGYPTLNAFPPHEYMEKAGLSDELAIDLYTLNDSEKCSFEEIADVIEEKL